MVGSAKPSEIKNSTPGIQLNFWNPLGISRHESELREEGIGGIVGNGGTYTKIVAEKPV